MPFSTHCIVEGDEFLFASFERKKKYFIHQIKNFENEKNKFFIALGAADTGGVPKNEKKNLPNLLERRIQQVFNH
jgi:hypothetical protein